MTLPRSALISVPPAPQPRESGVRELKPQAAEAVRVGISSEQRALAERDVAANSQKIESLKAAVANGTFEVDSNVVAQRMFEEAGR